MNRAMAHLRRSLAIPPLPPFSPQELESHGKSVIPGDERRGLSKTFTELKRQCEAIGLTISIDLIDRMLKGLSDPKYTRAKAERQLEDLEWRITDEMNHKYFLLLSPREMSFFTKPQRGWENIIARFPLVMGDLEEAQKCFALGRYAAAVFHSLQIVEVGLRQLADFIRHPNPGWTAVTHAVKKIIEQKFENRTEFGKRNYEFLEQIQAAVEVLNNSWRNKVIHAQGQLTVMTADFSPEIAEEILVASRNFMRCLATGLPSRESIRQKNTSRSLA